MTTINSAQSEVKEARPSIKLAVLRAVTGDAAGRA